MSAAAPTSRRLARLALLGGALATALLARGPGPARAEDSSPPFLVRDTRAAAVALERAERDLAGSDPARGLVEIQEILDANRGDLVLVGAARGSTRWISATDAARALLVGRSAAILEEYERLAAPSARALLARGVAARDERLLTEVAERFLPSKPAIEASRAIAESAFERGAPLDAIVALRRALPYARDDVGLWIRLVDALDAAGDGIALAALEVPEGVLSATTGAGPTTTVRARLEEARARSAPSIPDARDAARAAARATLAPLDRRLAQRHWAVGAPPYPRSNDPDRRGPPREDDPRMTEAIAARIRRLAPTFPTTDGRSVIAADGVSVASYDLLSGRRAWRVPEADKPPPPGLPVPDPSREALLGRTPLEASHVPFVSGGLVYALLETTVPYQARELTSVEITTYRPRRVLVAIDAASGALRWRMGESPGDARALAGLAAVSNPVVADGIAAVVLATWEKRWRILLAGFDAETGALRWSREVVGGQQELNLFGEPVHELFAGTPAVADGVLYATTGLGVVAALAMRSGEVRWLASVPTTELARVEVWFTTPIRLPTWGPAPVVVRGDALLAAPSEGPGLVCLERADGRLRWSIPSEARAESAFVDQLLGVVDDGKRDVVVVTGSSVRGLDLSDGRLVWRERLPAGTLVRGRGALSATTVYVPTSEGLSRFSIRGEGLYQGDEPWPSGAGPGNLLVLPEAIVVAGRRQSATDVDGYEGEERFATVGPIQAFYDRAEIEARIRRRRAERPDDPSLALDEADLARVARDARAEPLYEEGRRLAEEAGDAGLVERARRGLYLIRLERGDARADAPIPSEARTAYERALAVAVERSERIEVRARLDRLLAGHGLDAGRVANLEALAKEAGDALGVLDPEEGEVPVRVAARLRLADLHRAAKRPAEAVDALQAILLDDPTATVAGEAARSRASRGIAAIVREAGPSAYARHEREARRRLDAAMSVDDPEPVERLLAEYPNASVVPSALLALADRLAAAGATTDAASVYRRFLGAYPERAEAATVLARLARTLVAGRQRAPARATLATLERRHPDALVTIDGVTSTGAAFARAERERLGAAPAPVPERPIAPPTSLRLEEPYEAGRGTRVVPTVRASDVTTPPPVLVDTGADLVAVDGASASIRFRKPWGGSTALPVAVGDSLLVARSDDLVALDPRSGQELWRKTLPGTPTSIAAGLGEVVVAVRRAGDRSRHRIVAFDPVSSDELWAREIRDEPVDAILAGEEGLVIVRKRILRSPPGASRTIVVLAIHSLLTGEPVKEILLSSDSWLDATYGLADPRTLVSTTAGEGGVRVDATDLATGRVRWSRALAGVERVRYLVPSGDALAIVGFESGPPRASQAPTAVRVLSLATGEETRSARVAGGVECIFGTEPLLEGDRLVALLRAGVATVLASFDLKTGGVAWTLASSTPVHEGWLRRSGGFLVTIEAPRRFDRGPSPSHRIAIVDAATGAVVQRLVGEGVSGHAPSGAVSDGALVIVGAEAFAVYR